jgi:hypothetical protein
LVSWQGFLSEIASAVAANRTAKPVLAEFIPAQEDQFRRIEAVNQDLQYQLIRPVPGAEGLLDEPWRTALRCIQQAAGRPSRVTAAMAEAQENLLEAYAISRDSLRCSWIAQELAAAYAISGDLRNAKRWLESAYRPGLKGLKDQLWKAAEIIEAETENHARAYQSYLEQRSRARTRGNFPDFPQKLCSIGFRDEMSAPGPRPFKQAGWYGAAADATVVHRVVQGLGKLFNDLAQLRRTCLQARIDQHDLPLPYDPSKGGIRVASFVSGESFDSLAYFDTSPPYGLQFSTDSQLDAAIELGTFRYIYITHS